MGYKYYNQRDYNNRYDGGTIADSGCGGTSCAMLAHKHNTKWNPITVSDWLTKHGYASCGTEWGGITAFFNENGMKCTQYGQYKNQYGKKNGGAEKNWKKAMQKGTGTGILLMGSSMFTTGGHYIVIKKIKKMKNGNYKYLVWDPYTRGFCKWHTWDSFAGKVKQFYYVDVTWKAKNSTDELDGFKCGKAYEAKSNRPVRSGAKKSAKKVELIKKGEKATFTKLHRGPAYLWGKCYFGWTALKKLDDGTKYFK